MNPIVESAWIAAATGTVGLIGTVVVGVSGFRNTRSATEQSIQGDRVLRLWDKRAAAYEEALTALLNRKEERRALLAGGWVTQEWQQRAQALLAAYDQGEWWAMNGRLMAYSSNVVADAVDAANEAHRRVMEANERVKNLEDQVRTAGVNCGVVDATAAARQTLRVALQDSSAKENALVDIIRSELRMEQKPLPKAGPTDLMGGPDPR
jgi:hypothetical protein